jgi:hypothetical protein
VFETFLKSKYAKNVIRLDLLLTVKIRARVRFRVGLKLLRKNWEYIYAISHQCC